MPKQRRRKPAVGDRVRVRKIGGLRPICATGVLASRNAEWFSLAAHEWFPNDARQVSPRYAWSAYTIERK